MKKISLLALVLVMSSTGSAKEPISDMTCHPNQGDIRILGTPGATGNIFKIFIKRNDRIIFKDLMAKLSARELTKGKLQGHQFDFTMRDGATLSVWAAEDQSQPRKGEGQLKLSQPNLEATLHCRLKLDI